MLINPNFIRLLGLQVLVLAWVAKINKLLLNKAITVDSARSVTLAEQRIYCHNLDIVFNETTKYGELHTSGRETKGGASKMKQTALKTCK